MGLPLWGRLCKAAVWLFLTVGMLPYLPSAAAAPAAALQPEQREQELSFHARWGLARKREQERCDQLDQTSSQLHGVTPASAPKGRLTGANDTPPAMATVFDNGAGSAPPATHLPTYGFYRQLSGSEGLSVNSDVVMRLTLPHNHPDSMTELRKLDDEIINIGADLIMRANINRCSTKEHPKIYIFCAHWFPKLMGWKEGVPAGGYDYGRVKTWNKKNIAKYDIPALGNLFSFDFLLVPVFKEGHWLLLAADVKHRKIVIMDSLPEYMAAHRKEGFAHGFVRFLADYATDINVLSPGGVNNWTISHGQVPRQEGGEACGAFVLHFMEAISETGSLYIKNVQCNLTDPNGFEVYKHQLHDRILASPQFIPDTTSTRHHTQSTLDGQQHVAPTPLVTRGNNTPSGAGTSRIAATSSEQITAASNQLSAHAKWGLAQKQNAMEEEQKRKELKQWPQPLFGSTPQDMQAEQHHMDGQVKRGLSKTTINRDVANMTTLLAKDVERRRLQVQKFMKHPMVQEVGDLGPVNKTDTVNSLQLNALSNALATLDYNTSAGRCEQGRRAKGLILTATAHPELQNLRLVSHQAQVMGVDRKAVSAAMRKRSASAAAGDLTWIQGDRKKRSDAVPTAVQLSIHHFYENNTVVFPNKNAVIGERRRDTVAHPVHLQEKTDTEMYRLFRNENPDINIGQRTFMRYKPHYVKPLDINRHRQTCLCQECTDMRLQLESVAKHRATVANDTNNDSLKVTKSLSELIAKGLCPPRDGTNFYRLKCCKGECSSCSVSQCIPLTPTEQQGGGGKFKVSYYGRRPLNSHDDTSEALAASGTKKDKMVLDVLEKECTMAEFMQDFEGRLQGYAVHQHFWKWQQEQFNTNLANLGPDELLVDMDFSMNMLVQHKQEVQSEHWAPKTSISLFDAVVYHREGEQMVKEYHFCISDDKQHDPHWVKAALDAILSDVKLRYPHLSTVRTLWLWSDGCAAQFKSKHAFLSKVITGSESDLNITHNFKASGHGKGEVDGAATLLKNATHKATLKTPPLEIKSAQDWHTFLVANHSSPADTTYQSRKSKTVLKCRRYHLLPANIARAATSFTPRTVEGTRSHHCFSFSEASSNMTGIALDSSKNTDGVGDDDLTTGCSITINIRPGSCFCDKCRSGSYLECRSVEYAGEFKEAQLVKAAVGEDGGVDEHQQPQGSLHTLIRAGRDLKEPSALEYNCNIVVRQDDAYKYTDTPECYSFYLVRVVKGPYILHERTSDGFGNNFDCGSEVVQGRLFTLGRLTGSMLDQSMGMYEYNSPAKLVIVDVASITMVGFMMKDSGLFFQLSADDNDRALLSVETADRDASNNIESAEA